MPSKIKEEESFEAFKFAIEIDCLKIVRVGCAKSTSMRLNLFKDLYLLRRYKSYVFIDCSYVQNTAFKLFLQLLEKQNTT